MRPHKAKRREHIFMNTPELLRHLENEHQIFILYHHGASRFFAPEWTLFFPFFFVFFQNP